MNPSISVPAKLPNTGTSIFTTMSAMAQQYEAINLSQGFPDFSPDPALVSYLADVSEEGLHQYAPMPGLPALRQSISRLVAGNYGVQYDPDQEITVTSGATEALFCACQTMIEPGDEVIVFAPAYDAYVPDIELAGGVPVFVPLQYPDFHIDWDLVREHLTPRTRGIFLNSPHNPTGSTLSGADIDALAQLAEEHDLWVVSDEVYEYIIFDGESHLSLAMDPRLRPRTLVISSFGKTLHTTGWKVGYCLATPEVTAAFRKIHQFVTFAVPTPFQHALSRYVEAHPGPIDALRDFYQAKRDLFLAELAGSRFEPLPCRGTYFQLMKHPKIAELGDVAFSEWLTQKVGVACIPVSVFFPDQRDHGVVRFCFAKSDETIRTACKILREV